MRTAVSMNVLGELLLTLGVITLLFTGYELYGTDLVATQGQQQASAELDKKWAAPPVYGPALAAVVGGPTSRIYIPALGSSFVRTVLEGVDQVVLAKGPGHYPDTVSPGSVGNAAIAGHRVTHGAPFDALGDLQSCDALVVETRTAWLVYRVLPFDGERGDWARIAASKPDCSGIKPLEGDYADTAGREIVEPSDVGAIAPVPHRTGVVPQLRLLTLTTCNPRFSARQRLVLHAMMVTSYSRGDHPAGWRPAELGRS